MADQKLGTLVVELEARTQEFQKGIAASERPIAALGAAADKTAASIGQLQAAAARLSAEERKNLPFGVPKDALADLQLRKRQEVLEHFARNEAKWAQERIQHEQDLARRVAANAALQGSAARNSELAQARAAGAIRAVGASYELAAKSATTAASQSTTAWTRAFDRTRGAVKGAGLELAALFGAQGLIVVAVSYAVTAIINLFTKARNESRQLKEQIQDNIRDIARMSLDQATATRDQLLQGDKSLTPEYIDSKVKPRGDTAVADARARARGVREINLEIAALNAVIEENSRIVLQQGGESYRAYNATAQEAQSRVAAFREQLKLIEPEYQRAAARVQELTTVEQALARARKIEEDAEKRRREGLASAKRLPDDIQSVRDELAKLGESITPEKADNIVGVFDRLAAKIAELKQRGAPSEVIDEMTAALRRLREAAFAKENARLDAMVAGFFSKESASRVDDLRAKFDALLAELERAPDRARFEPVIEKLRKLRDASADALTSIEEMAAASDKLRLLAQVNFSTQGLGGIGVFGLPSAGDLDGILRSLEQQKRTLEGIANDESVALEVREKAKAQLAEIVRLTAEWNQATGQTRTAIEDTGFALQEAVDLAFGIATALDGADSSVTKFLGSLGQVVRAMTQIQELASKAGGFGKLFSSPEVSIGSLFSSIGLLVGGIGAIGTLIGDSPEDRARKQAIEDNTKALEDVSRNLADLARTSAPGATIDAVQKALAQAAIVPLTFGPLRGEVQKDNFARFEAALRGFGLTLEDARKLAKDFGINLDAGTAGLLQFKELLDSLDFSAFTETFAGGQEQIDLETLLFGDNLQTQIEKTIALLNDPKKGAPAIFAALADVDLSTAEGREAAKNIIRGIYQQFLSGDITPADLGGLSFDEFKGILSGLFGDIIDLDEEFIRNAEKLKAEAEAALEAEKAAQTEAEQEAEAARAKKIAEARAKAAQLSALFDDDVGESLTRLLELLAPLSPAIAGLLDGLDLSTPEGITAAKEALRALFKEIEDGGLTAEELGDLSIPELIELILEFDGSLDSLAGAIAGAASEAETAAEKLNKAFSDLDFDLRLLGIDDPVERAKKTATAAGSAFPQITAAIGGFDLTTEAGRAGAIAALQALGIGATDEALRRAILATLDAIRDIPGAIADEAGAAVEKALPEGQTKITGSLATATLQQADVLIGLGQTNLFQNDRRDTILTAILATLRGGPSIAPPVLPPSPAIAAAAAGTTALRATPAIISFGSISIVVQGGASARETGERIAEAFVDEVEQALATRAIDASLNAGANVVTR
jgi:hypothetical protein